MTRLGRILDPAADRLYIFATVLGLAARGLVPWWLVAVLLARDLMLVVLAVILANNGYGPLPVHHLGKFATFCLFYALPLIMLGQAFPALAPASLPSPGPSCSGVRSSTGGRGSSTPRRPAASSGDAHRRSGVRRGSRFGYA